MSSARFALIDCDHFFASCERVFRPDLARRPVAVLSNQDGCVIARSPEVKALGVKMGEPLFQCESRLRAAGASVFSANFQLYADLSARIMEVLGDFGSRLQVYSIDEAFIELRGLSPSARLCLAAELRDAVWREVGVPVSIGLGETMTLAKLASRFAKRSAARVWQLEGAESRRAALAQSALDEVWGIGPRWARALTRQGLDNALALTEASSLQLSALNRVGRQTVDELKGERRFMLETAPPQRKSARVSRSFAEQVFDEVALCEAMSHFASKLGARLRRQGLTSASLVVWLEAAQPGARHASGRPQRAHFKAERALPQPCNDSSTLIQVSLEATRQLARAWALKRRQGQPLGGWRKGGILALDLRAEEERALDFYAPNPARAQLSALEDQLNQRFGRQTAQVGGSPKAQRARPQGAWRQRASWRSPRYTSSWAELLTINVDEVYKSP